MGIMVKEQIEKEQVMSRCDQARKSVKDTISLIFKQKMQKGQKFESQENAFERMFKQTDGITKGKSNDVQAKVTQIIKNR